MRRNWMVGAAVSILVAAALLAVGVGAYNAGQRHGDTVQVLTNGESTGRAVVVPVTAWRGGWGPGFLLFPLIVIGLILLFSARRRGGWGSGWCPPGAGGRYADDDRALQDWHRRVHAEGADAAPVTAPAPDDGR